MESVDRGETLAADPPADPRSCEVRVSVTIRWGGDAPGSSSCAVTEDPARIDNGEFFGDSGFEVNQTIFETSLLREDSEGRLHLEGPPSIRLRFEDRSRSERSHGTADFKGKFVG